MTLTEMPTRHPKAQVAAIAVRVVLFAVVGMAGWSVGATLGGVIGVGLDLMFTGERMPGPGVAVSPFWWICGWLGAIGGMVGSVAWLAGKTDRQSA